MMMMLPAGLASLIAYVQSKCKDVPIDLFDTTFYKLEEKSPDEHRVDICQVKSVDFKKYGIEYNTTDMKEDFIQNIKTFQPDIVAVSCNDFTHGISDMLIKDLHKQFPNIHVIEGGLFPTFWPKHVIDNPDIDSLCIGEGFEALVELIERLSKKEDITNIQNLWVKKDGNLYKNNLRPPIDLNILPHDNYEIFGDKRLYRPMQGKLQKMVNIWLDAGCPYNCTYCCAPALRNLYKDHNHKYLRIKSIDKLKSEVRYLVDKHNPDFIYISTENFFSRPESHIKEFAEFYKKEIGLPFWAETRVENITNERARLLKDMNIARLSMGLESGCEDFRVRKLNKTFTNNQFLNAVSILNDHGIKITINSIIGLPDETRQQIWDTINLNKAVYQMFKNVDYTTTVTTYAPCGGSGLQKYALEQGYYDLDKYLNLPYGSFHRNVFLDMPQITPEEVKGLLRTFPLYVRLPIEHYFNIRKAEKSPEGDEMFAELRELYWKTF